MSVKETSTRKRYELVAPDGGWGYMIWIAITINMIILSSFVSCIGMMYNDIYIQLEMDSKSINLLNGIGSMSVSIAAFITGPLLNYLSIRKLGLVSIIVLNLGTFATAFVNSKALFFFANGILQGFGNGVLINLTFTTLNQYFDKKQMLTVAVTQTIAAVVALFTPQFVNWSSDLYGSRGTLILLSGINMQTFIAIALMQPVKWHLKKRELETINDVKNNELKTLLKPDEATKKKISGEKIHDTESFLQSPVEKKALSHTEDIKQNSVFREMFKDFYDIPFLKSFLLSNASIGLAIICFSEVIFMIMLPQALYSMDWSERDVAWAISLSNFGDWIMKGVFILLNNILLKFGNNEIYVVALFMAFFARLGMLWSDDPTIMLVFIFVIGMARSILTMLNSLVIADNVDKEKFTTAMGIFMLLFGIIFIILGPLVGAVRDLTNSYGTAFYIITSCYGIVSLFWIIELLYKKNKDKRVKQLEP